MSLDALSIITQSPESYDAGRIVGKELVEHFGGAPQVAIAYQTINHDQAAFLAGMRDAIGADGAILGCSAQGVMGRDFLLERGYIAGVMGIGGDGVHAVGAEVRDINVDTRAKGVALGRSLVDALDGDPKAVVLNYDPLCGADMDPFLEGLVSEVQCPVVGGGAGHFYGPMRTTFQYFEGAVFSAGAVAVAITGNFTVETGFSTGCSPVGIEMTVTASDGPWLLGLDGAPALDVWREVAGSGNPDVDHTAALALGVPFTDVEGEDGYLIRAAFGSDDERGGVLLQSSIPVGTSVMLHHRTTSDVLQGTVAMGERLAERVAGKTVRMVLGFECGARTEPFLGARAALDENKALQAQVGADAQWLGMLAWGEIHTHGLHPTFNNYTYPLLVVAE